MPPAARGGPALPSGPPTSRMDRIVDPTVAAFLVLAFILAMALTSVEMIQSLQPPSCPECPHCQALRARREREREQPPRPPRRP